MAKGSENTRSLDAGARAAFLARITTVLASTLDVEEMLRRLARLLVPGLGDWCVIDLLGHDGQLERVAVGGQDERRCGAGRLERALPAVDESDRASFLAAALAGSPALHLRVIPPRSEARCAAERAHLELLADLGASEVIVVGLRARHRTLGVLTLAAVDHAYGDDDVALAEDLAVRVALAVHNAWQYGEQRAVSEALQRSLLPTLPDRLPVALTTRYHPAQQGLEIGGDWYDAFVLPDQVTALVIGDVVGHDFAAAVRMGRVRNMLRALAWDRREPPREVLRRLDGAVVAYHPDLIASSIFARVEEAQPGWWRLRWANAGHPPPVLITPGQHASLLSEATGPFLGVMPTYQREDAVTALPPGARVLLYTDGLIEHRRESLDVSLARLRRAADAFADAPAEKLCDALLDELDPDTDDDVALLVLDIPPSDEEHDTRREETT